MNYDYEMIGERVAATHFRKSPSYDYEISITPKMIWGIC